MKDLCLEFYPEESIFGLATFSVRSDESKVKIRISYAFDPIPEMAKFLTAIVEEFLPNQFDIDEEGRVKTLVALPVEDKRIFRFMVFENEEKLFDAEYNRREFVLEFLNFYKTHIHDTYLEWEMHTDPLYVEENIIKMNEVEKLVKEG